AQQAMGRDRLIGTLDPNQLRLAESRCAINQPSRGLTEHDPARRSRCFHPLGHTDLLADGGVTESPRTDLTGVPLARVQAHPQLQLDTVALWDVGGKPLRLLLDTEGRPA